MRARYPLIGMLLVATIVAVIAGPGSRTAAPARGGHSAQVGGACGPATAATVAATLGAVGSHIYGAEHKGGGVELALSRTESSAALRSAVERNDPAAARAAIIGLLQSHIHISRIRVVRGGHVLAAVGVTNALAPVSGTLRANGRTIAHFVLSIQDQHGYVLLVQRFTGMQVVLAAGGRDLPDSTLFPAPARIPAHGTITYRGATYEAYSFDGQRFPGTPLRISLLMRPAMALAGEACADVARDTLAAVAGRVYRESIVGPNAQAAVRIVRGSPALRSAVAARDPAAVRAEIGALVASGNVGRVRVLVGSRVLGDVGPPDMLAPISGALGGNARFVLSLQRDDGYVTIVHAVTGAVVLVRNGSGQLAGNLNPGPAAVPTRGPVAYNGVTYNAVSFTATAFPSGQLRIYLLVR